MHYKVLDNSSNTNNRASLMVRRLTKYLNSINNSNNKRGRLNAENEMQILQLYVDAQKRKPCILSKMQEKV